MAQLWPLFGFGCALFHILPVTVAPLSDDIIPQRYNLSIVTLLEPKHANAKGNFEGNVHINLYAGRDTYNITLNAKELQLTKIWLMRLNTGRRITLNRTETNADLGEVNLYFNNRLWLGENYQLQLKFSGQLSKEQHGYYMSSYLDGQNATSWLTVTHFRRSYAREAFPCFDEPRFKTTFIINMAHHEKLQAVSNMPVGNKQRHEELENYVWTCFNESLPMPTYLVAFSINRLVKQSQGRSKLPALTAWTRPGASEQSKYALEVSAKLIDYYVGLFDFDYALPKIDQLSLPDMTFDAIECWGIISHAESIFLYDKRSAPLPVKQWVAGGIALRLVRQWFGNLVSVRAWNEAWFEVGLSLYLAGFGLDHIEPTWQQHEQDMLKHVFFVFDRDARVHTFALAADQTSEWLTSKKSALLFRMLHHVVGSGVFLRALRSFLQLHAHGLGSPDQLWTILQTEADKSLSLRRDINLTQLMHSWTRQPGIPLLSVQRDYERHSAVITQQRFIQAPPHDSNLVAAYNCWWVPLSYTSSRQPNFAHSMPRNWLICPPRSNATDTAPPLNLTELATADDWVIFNLRLSAPYRVNYDRRNWLLINQTLAQGKLGLIDRMNRAQLIDDALTLAWSGLQPYNISLSLINYLQREDEFVVWDAALRCLDRISSVLKQTSGFRLFKSYMRILLEPKYNQLFGAGQPLQNASLPLVGIIRKVSCAYDVEACVNRATEQFASLRLSQNDIPLDERAAVYCTAIRLGTEADWALLRDLYRRSTVPSEKIAMLDALGCSRDNWAMEKVLRWTFNGKDVAKHHARYTFKIIVQNPVGYHLASGYLVENIDVIRNFCGNVTNCIAQIVRPLFAEVSTKKDLSYFQDFLKNNLEHLPGMDAAIKLLIERGLDNIRWRRNHYTELLQVIQDLTSARPD